MPKRAVFERSRRELSLDASVGVHILLVVERSSLESQSRGCAKTSIFKVCVCVFFPFILDIKFVGRTSRGHTGGRSHRISHPPSFCGAQCTTPLSLYLYYRYYYEFIFLVHGVSLQGQGRTHNTTEVYPALEGSKSQCTTVSSDPCLPF